MRATRRLVVVLAAVLAAAALSWGGCVLAGRLLVARPSPPVAPGASGTQAAEPAPRVRSAPVLAPDAVRVAVRSTTGEPIRGAVVELFRGPATDDLTDQDNFRPSAVASPPVQTVSVDVAGASLLEGVAEGRWFVVGSATGFGRHAVGVTRDAGGTDAEVLLAPGRPLGGTLTDDAGSPLPGVGVVLAPTQSSMVWPSDAACLRTASGQDGTWSFDAVAPGEYRLWIVPATGIVVARACVRVPALDRCDLRLVRGARIDGVVRDADTGAPVPKARVLVGSGFSNVLDPGVAVCDGDGRFSFATWAEKTHVGSLRVDAAGYAPVPVDDSGRLALDTVVDGQHLTADLRVRRGFVVEGMVTGLTGPLPGIEVNLLPESEREEARVPGRWTRTDAEGRYRFDRVPAGLARAIAYPFDSDYWAPRAEASAEVGAAATTTCDVRVVAEKLAARGRVLAPGGEPLAGVRVAFGRGPLGVQTTTGADGRFALDAWRVQGAAEVIVTIRADGFVPASRWLTDDHDAGDVALEEVSTDRGRVLDADGRPVAGARVSTSMGDIGQCVFIYRWPGEIETATGADGTFVLPLTTNDVEMVRTRSIASGTFGGWRPPDTSVKDTRLPSVVRVAGRVVAAGARAPVANAFVALASHWEDTVIGRTGADGSFDVPVEVRPGEALPDLRVSADGFLAQKFDPEGFAGPFLLELRPSLSIDGVLTGPDGRPMPWIDVAAKEIGASEESAAKAWATTDTDGRFILRGLQPGHFDVTASPRGQEFDDVTLPVAAGARGVALKLTRPAAPQGDEPR